MIPLVTEYQAKFQKQINCQINLNKILKLVWQFYFTANRNNNNGKENKTEV